ncbi:aminotransferase class III-fold pyridoxal phosphate-dependent enzyme [Taklimakanibacter lacteus]|uniref:aminotransferase class III-fold pyridoxal phosphate-dependent enzyme n=1 Tax=Taklimakanibacter lacteus TaxID=2268456 RepID=UPI000E660CE9
MSIINHPGPEISESLARQIAEAHFGLSGPVSRLASERDQNFHFAGTGQGAVLKIVNAAEPEQALRFQVAMIGHIRKVDPGLAVPPVRVSKSGEELPVIDGAKGERHLIRAVDYLAGTPLAEKPKTPALLESFGSFLGRLDRALQSFGHPGAHRDLDWDLRKAGRSRARMTAIDDPGQREICDYFLTRFETLVEPRLNELRAGVIHNDANDWNVLVSDDGSEISGLIDFGDALHTTLIAELGVAAAYAILDADDPLGAVAHMLMGYHRELPLHVEEIDLLFDLIAMRLVTSVTISAERAPRVAGNPYLNISEKPAWDMLRRFRRIDPFIAKAILRQACGFEVAPGAGKAAGWLARNRKALSPIWGRPLSNHRILQVPFGDASHPLVKAAASMDVGACETAWQALRKAENAELGIGPWGERRAIYAGKMFESKLIRDVRRTRHLGLDIFAEAGTLVMTPLAGRVTDVRIEREPLGYGCVILIEHEPEPGVRFSSLWGHLSHETAAHLKEGQLLQAGERIGTLGNADENGGWLPHLHLQLVAYGSDDAEPIPGVGEEAYLDLWAKLYPPAYDFAGLTPETFQRSGRTSDEIVAARKRTLLPNLSISFREPLKMVRGEGVWLIADDGRAYLDCFNNVAHLGHAHPEIVEVLAREASRLNTNTRYLHDNIVDYAEVLGSTLPGDLKVASFVCTGSEANDLALRMMRAKTGQNDIVVVDWAYHGHGAELIDISPYKYKRAGGEGRKAHVWEAELPDTYRAPADWPAEEHGRRFAESIARQVAAIRKAGKRPAAFIAESIPSCGGQIFFPPHYLEEAYRIIRDAGGLCIADEVQVGLGRVGSHMWAFETQGVVPDIVTMGKPIGNGHPLAALVTTPDVARAFNNGMEYFNTFGGNPVSCAIGLKVLEIIDRDRLRDNAAAMGDYLLSRFRSLQQRHESIGDVRGMGLFLGLDLVTDRASRKHATEFANRVVNLAREEGVLIGTDGPYDNVVKMRPAMIFSKTDADLLCDVLDHAFTRAVA